MSAGHQRCLSADPERTFVIQRTMRIATAFHFTASVALYGFNGTDQGFHANLNNMSTIHVSHSTNRPFQDAIQELGVRCFAYSFQLRDTTTSSRPCMPCHGARLRSPASPDYFDLTSRISVRHRPPESGSFDRSALELRAQRSSSPFCTFARPPPIGTTVRTVMVVVNSFV